MRQNIYIEKYKGIRLMLNTLTNALSGNYVNFGIFSLYQDTALQNALDISLQICLQIPLADILTYIKLSRAYFAFLEVLFRSHLDVLSGLDSGIFIQLIKTCQEGLQSSGNYYQSRCLCMLSLIRFLRRAAGEHVLLERHRSFGLVPVPQSESGQTCQQHGPPAHEQRSGYPQ